MSKTKKIFWVIAFIFLATIIVRMVLLENHVKPQASCSICKIIFSKDNGSLPPDYHRNYVFTAYEDGQKISADYEISSGYGGTGLMAKKILKNGPVNLPANEFKKIVENALSVNPTLKSGEDKLAGCTGGSGQSLKIYDKDNPIFEAENYSCAGRESNASLGSFATSINKYFP